MIFRLMMINLAASIPMISTPVGCLLSLLTMKAGRRFAMGSAGTVCSLGWIVLATSYSPSQLLIGRCITGFATGMASTPASVYLAEISMPRYTTMLTACSSFFISIGIMFVYLLGFLIKVRILLKLCKNRQFFFCNIQNDSVLRQFF